MTAVRRLLLAITLPCLVLLASSCSDRHHTAAGSLGPTPSPSPPPPPPSGLSLQTVKTGLDYPVYLVSPPADTARLFIVEKGGKIRILKSGVLLATPFLDVSSLVSTGGEQGLFSMAFPPDYATRKRFYISYTDLAGDSKVVRYHVNSASDDVAVGTPDETVLSIDQPAANHNGGLIAFGPDGMLWLGFGDGGGNDDTYGNGQSTDDLLGSMLRVDVSGASGYTIPAGNPYTGVSDRHELWDIGLRNPWRWSFDRLTGDLYIGDVGQDTREEIDVAPASLGRSPKANYGWPITEGLICRPPTTGCDLTGLTPPVVDYAHDPSNCWSVVGGYVYRGAAMPGLHGVYFYADYCVHSVHSFVLLGGTATQLTDWPSLDPGDAITSFGQDTRGEIYILTAGGGVFRIVGS